MLTGVDGYSIEAGTQTLAAPLLPSKAIGLTFPSIYSLILNTRAPPRFATKLYGVDAILVLFVRPISEEKYPLCAEFST